MVPLAQAAPLGTAAAAIGDQRRLLAWHAVGSVTSRQLAQTRLIATQGGAQRVQDYLAGARDGCFTQVFVAQLHGVRGDDIDCTAAIARAHNCTSLLLGLLSVQQGT